MGFVNEYVSDEDIEKYDLHGIWDKYHPFRKGRYYGGNRPHWTINRQSNTYLMAIGVGRGEHGNRKTFLLWVDGAHVTVEVDLVKGSSGDLDANPFILIWELAGVEIPALLENQEDNVISTFKDALRAYGYWGIWNQRPNTVVELKF